MDRLEGKGGPAPLVTQLTTNSLGFRLQRSGDSGKLSCDERTLFGFLHLDRLELEIPNLELPIDLSAGPELFQRRRTRVSAALLRMQQRDLEVVVEAARAKLRRRGIDHVVLRSADGYLSLGAQVRDAAQVGELTARVHLIPRDSRLCIAVNSAQVYGFHSTPGPLLAHEIVATLIAQMGSYPPGLARRLRTRARRY